MMPCISPHHLVKGHDSNAIVYGNTRSETSERRNVNDRRYRVSERAMDGRQLVSAGRAGGNEQALWLAASGPAPACRMDWQRGDGLEAVSSSHEPQNGMECQEKSDYLPRKGEPLPGLARLSLLTEPCLPTADLSHSH